MTRRKDSSRPPRQYWTPEEDDTLCALYPFVRTEDIAREIGRSTLATHARARFFDLRKSDEFLATAAAGRTNGSQGIGTRFVAGHVPANKGVKRGRGWAPGRMRDGQFKKGERRGVSRVRWKPVGTERVTRDGYLERKVRDFDATGMSREEANRKRQRIWRPVHVLVWEEANGPIPPGHAVVFRNGDKADIRPENLECLSRREVMLRNSVHNLPAPLPQMVQLLGALNRKINRKTRHEEQAQRSA